MAIGCSNCGGAINKRGLNKCRHYESETIKGWFIPKHQYWPDGEGEPYLLGGKFRIKKPKARHSPEKCQITIFKEIR